MSATYVVFARNKSQQPLTRIGTVTVKEGTSVEDSVTRERLDSLGYVQADGAWTWHVPGVEGQPE